MGYGMDEVEQDQHEARLKELFDSFDTTGTGSLGQEELTDLCQMLSLEEVAPVLQETLLQDNLLGRVRSGDEQDSWWGVGLAAGGGTSTCYNLFLKAWLCVSSHGNPVNRTNVSGWGLAVPFSGDQGRLLYFLLGAGGGGAGDEGVL